MPLEFVGAFSDPEQCCRVICAFYGLSVGITYAEKLVNAGDYAADGWFPWTIFRFDRQHLPVFRSFPRLTEFLFGPQGMVLVLTLGLLGVFGMWLAPIRTPAFTGGVSFVVLSSLVLHFRSTYGGDGSQQVNLIIGATVLLTFNPWVKPAVGGIGLFFIAAQACLAYTTSGFAKLVSPFWMQREPLIGILATTAYGSELGFRLVATRGPLVRRSLTVGMVLTETLFPLCLVGPDWLLVVAICWGVSFHVANAVFMGLNTFVWSFVATYPAICYVWLLLHP